MVELNLHPCATHFTWLSEQALTDAGWKIELQSFLADLSKNCIANGGSLIGHIKGIAMVAGRPCLQLSVVSENRPANIEGRVPEDTQKLCLALNVLVFGMSAKVLTTTISDTTEQTSKSWPGSIDVEILPAATEFPLVSHAENG